MSTVYDVPNEIWTKIARRDLRIYNTLVRTSRALTKALYEPKLREKYRNQETMTIKSKLFDADIGQISTLMGAPHSFVVPHNRPNAAFICCASYGRLTKFSKRIPSFKVINDMMIVQIHAEKGRLKKIGGPAMACWMGSITFEVYADGKNVSMIRAILNNRHRHYAVFNMLENTVDSYDVPVNATGPGVTFGVDWVCERVELIGKQATIAKVRPLSRATSMIMLADIEGCCNDVANIMDHLESLAKWLSTEMMNDVSI